MGTRGFLRVVFTLALSLLILAGALVFLESWSGVPQVVQAQGTTRYVAALSGQDVGNCASQAAPCQTIQYAVDQAQDGDELRIATFEVAVSPSPGGSVTRTTTYTGGGDNVIVLTKSLTLRGGYLYMTSSKAWVPGPIPATVDGEQLRRGIQISGSVTATLERIAFVNGQAERGGNVYVEGARVTFRATPVLSGTADYGGGLYLKDCRAVFDVDTQGNVSLSDLSGLLQVRSNHADYGAGLYVDGGTPVLTGLDVASNVAAEDGGGLYLLGGHPLIAAGAVRNNQAGGRGGGFYLQGSPARIAGMAVISNMAAEGAGLYLDGPLAFSEAAVPIIANNYIRHNVGGTGGGIYFHQAVAGLVNDVVADNQAAHGAGLYLYASSPQVYHNTVAQNVGDAGIYLTHKPGQIWPPVLPVPSQPTFTNTIIVSHTVGVYVDSTGLPFPFENQATLQGTLWDANGSDTRGAGLVNCSADVTGAPKFTCTGSPPSCLRPYHVLTDSAAVDAGVPVALKLPGTDLMVDIDGQLRPSGAGYDIGADEIVSGDYSVWLIPPLSVRLAEAGQTVTHTHLLMNSGVQTDIYTLTAHSSTGWATSLFSSPIELAPQAYVTVPVRVVVPPSAANGVSDTTMLTVTSANNAQAEALDVTGVVTGALGDLIIEKWADRTQVRSGEVVHFTVIITKTGVLSGTVRVTDTVVPTDALSLWTLPPHCTGAMTTGEIVCEWTLPLGATPLTRTFQVTITTSEVYSGVLINTAKVTGDTSGVDPTPVNNTSQAVVGVLASTSGVKVYLPLVMRNY